MKLEAVLKRAELRARFVKGISRIDATLQTLYDIRNRLIVQIAPTLKTKYLL